MRWLLLRHTTGSPENPKPQRLSFSNPEQSVVLGVKQNTGDRLFIPPGECTEFDIQSITTAMYFFLPTGALATETELWLGGGTLKIRYDEGARVQ